jgi:hypothetical protein
MLAISYQLSGVGATRWVARLLSAFSGQLSAVNNNATMIILLMGADKRLNSPLALTLSPIRGEGINKGPLNAPMNI